MTTETYYGKVYEWDEEAKAEVHNVRDRKTCLSHEWINASLSCDHPSRDGGKSFYISLDCWGHEKPYKNPGWGKGYGGIRFCRKCKAIDCIHLWADDEPSDESWRSCDHEWKLRQNGADCHKCGASYNFMCGCGGSLYVCPRHYEVHMARMVEDEGSIDAYLNKNCSAPRVPIIKTCLACERRIMVGR